jgi:hypothetical protein
LHSQACDGVDCSGHNANEQWQKMRAIHFFRKCCSNATLAAACRLGPLWHPSCSRATLKAGIGVFRAGGDFQKYYSASISPIDSQGARPLAFDGEPGNQPDIGRTDQNAVGTFCDCNRGAT